MAFFTGTPASNTQLSTLNPAQQGLQNQSINQALSLLQGGAGFAPIEQRARTQFQTQTVPGLAERFTSLGGGAQRSSAFQGALGQAGAGLEEGLGALRSQYEQNQLSQLLGAGLTPSVENFYQPKGHSFLGSLSSAFAQGVGQSLPLFFGYGSGGSLRNLFGKGQQTGQEMEQLDPQKQQQLQDLLGQIKALIGG